MLILYYFNWAGTAEELKEYTGRCKSVCDGIKGVDLKGVFGPTSGWNFVQLFGATSYEKGLEIMRTYRKKYGPPKITLAKAEILHTLEELGIQSS